ncbi:MAG TPA: acyltransferase family protein, partial [Acidimicrobiales bacterium]
LITTLLLEEHGGHGAVALRAFWARRARRLLPAVLLLLAALSVYTSAGGAGVVGPQLRAPALATLFYAANWQQIVSGHGYFAQFVAPGPLQHTWSLAIEEQYYAIWPVLFVAIMALTRGSRRRLVAVIGGLMTASVVWMGVAAHLFGANRAYLGTDTRAWELLLGALAAVIWKPRAAADEGGRRAWSVASGLGLAGFAIGVSAATGPPGWVWDGGTFAIALCVVAVIVGSIRAPLSPVGRLLSLPPMRWLGRISYSLYLWHWPAIVVLTPAVTGLSGGVLLAVRLGAMTAAACASYYAVERPLRHADWGSWRRRALVPATVAGMAVAVIGATVTPTGAASGAVTTPAPSVDASVAPITAPLRVWILGDSVMYDSSLGLQAALAATGAATVVANSSYGGWGLTTDHGWPADARAIIARTHPNVVIGTWSWDDPSAFFDPPAYTERLRQALSAILAPGEGVDLVVLLQFPQAGPPIGLADPARQQASYVGQTAQQRAWDADARAATESFPGRAVYLPTDGLFAPGGRFVTWMRTPTGTWIRARKLDGAHLCPYGAAELGALVVGDLASALRLGPLAPGWESGPWIHDHRYDDPPGACPADQPPSGYTGTPVPRS